MEEARQHPALGNIRERRRRAFRYHMAGYFAVMAVPVAVNLLVTPETPRFVWPMIGWGGVLAFHTAWVMGLFDTLSGGE